MSFAVLTDGHPTTEDVSRHHMAVVDTSCQADDLASVCIARDNAGLPVAVAPPVHEREGNKQEDGQRAEAHKISQGDKICQQRNYRCRGTQTRMRALPPASRTSPL